MRRSDAIVVSVASASSTRRASVAQVLRRCAFIVLSAAIVLSPFRARFEVMRRETLPVYSDFTSFLLFWSDIACLVVLGLWATALASDPRPIEFGPRFIRWSVIALIGMIWLGAVTSVDTNLSLYAATRITVLAALSLFVVNEVRVLGHLLPAVAIMIVIQAIVAVSHVVQQDALGLDWLGERDLDPAVGGTSVVTSSDGSRLLRGYGLADHPNILGGLLAFGIVVLMAALPRVRQSARPIATVVIGLGAMAMILTFSRGAALGLFIGAAILFGISIERRWWSDVRALLLAGAAALLLSLTIIVPYRDHLVVRVDAGNFQAVGTEQRSITERAALVEATNDLIIENPILGTGVGTAALAMSQAVPDFEFNYQPAHMVLLVVAAEAGLIAAVAYAIILVGPWIALLVKRRQITAELAAASALIATVTTVGLVDYYTWSYPAGQLWFWLAIGSWCAAYRGLDDA